MFKDSGLIFLNVDDFNSLYGLYVFWLVSIVATIFSFLKVKNQFCYSGTLRKKEFISAVESMSIALCVINMGYVWSLGSNMQKWVEMMISLSIIVLVMLAAMFLLKNHKAELARGHKVYNYEPWFLRFFCLVALASYVSVYLNGLIYYGVL